jgi:hypothetical protein
MAKALGLGIGGDEFSNLILVQRPGEGGNYSIHKEIQEGKDFQYHAISSEGLLLPQIQPEPKAWMLGLSIFILIQKIALHSILTEFKSLLSRNVTILVK